MSNMTTENHQPGMPRAPKTGADFTRPNQTRGGKKPKAKSTRRRMMHCKQCKNSFRGILGQLYCSDRCRKKAAYRREHPVSKQRKPKPAPVLEPRTCAHCNDSFWAKQLHQRFCCESCKCLAYRARRSAAVRALATLYGLPLHQVEDYADQMGAAKLQEILRAAGYDYDERARQWFKPETESEAQYV